MNINLFKFQSHFYTIFNSDVLKKCIVLFGFEFSSVQLKNDFKLDYTPDKYLTKNLLSLVYKTSLIYCLKIKKIFYISKLPFYLLKFKGFNLKSNNYFKLSFIFTIKIQFTLSRCYLKLLDLYKNFFDLDCNFNLLVLNSSGKENFLFINEFLNQNKNILKKIFFINFYIKIYKKDSKIKNFDIKWIHSFNFNLNFIKSDFLVFFNFKLKKNKLCTKSNLNLCLKWNFFYLYSNEYFLFYTYQILNNFCKKNLLLGKHFFSKIKYMPYTGKVEILNHNILTKKFVIKRLLKLGFYFFKNFYSKKLLVINPHFKYFYKKKLQIYFNFVKLFTQEYSRVLFNYTSLNRLIMKSKGITTNSKLVDFSIKKYLKHISFLEIRTSTILKKIQNLNSPYVELNDNYYLRQSLIPNILQSLVLNEYRVRSGCYYYELGTVFPEENKTIFELNSLASVFLYNFHINFFWNKFNYINRTLIRLSIFLKNICNFLDISLDICTWKHIKTNVWDFNSISCGRFIFDGWHLKLGFINQHYLKEIGFKKYNFCLSFEIFFKKFTKYNASIKNFVVNKRYFNQISVNLSIKMHMLMFLNFLKKKIANFFKLYKCIVQSINILDCYYEKNFKKILICLRFVDISTINLDNLKIYLNLDPSLIVI